MKRSPLFVDFMNFTASLLTKHGIERKIECGRRERRGLPGIRVLYIIRFMGAEVAGRVAARERKEV